MTAMNPPDWAVEKARASLKLGMKVSEIEELLVSQGLKPEEANAAVMSILYGESGSSGGSTSSGELFLNRQLILSLLIAVACVGIVYWLGGGLPAAWTFAVIFPGLFCIWLPVLKDFDGDYFQTIGWIWLLLAGAARIFLVAIWNRPI